LTLIIDVAPLVALGDTQETQRDRILEILTNEPGALVIPAPTATEVDYPLTIYSGSDSAVAPGVRFSATSPLGGSWSPGWTAKTTQP